MDSRLYVWARQREIERELARLDLLTAAKELAAQDAAAEKQSRPSQVPRRLRGLASGALSPLRVR